jgi:hypothetical protein
MSSPSEEYLKRMDAHAAALREGYGPNDRIQARSLDPRRREIIDTYDNLTEEGKAAAYELFGKLKGAKR